MRRNRSPSIPANFTRRLVALLRSRREGWLSAASLDWGRRALAQQTRVSRRAALLPEFRSSALISVARLPEMPRCLRWLHRRRATRPS